MTTTNSSEQVAELLDRCLADVDCDNLSDLTAGLRNFYDTALQQADEQFEDDDRGIPCSQYLSLAADEAVIRIAENLPTPDVSLCWVAMGGFGRGLLSPGSSVRIALLHNCEDPDVAETLLEDVSKCLDQSLPRTTVKGYTIGDALRRMGTDTLLASDLLETRLLHGDQSRYDEFRDAVTSDFLDSNWGRFGEEALGESLASGDPSTRSPYRTELNLKESPGGLRDTGTLMKLADALLEIPQLETYWEGIGGAANGILTAEERDTLESTHRLLLRMRNELQFMRGPNSDALEMRVQPALAQAMGYAQEEEPPDEGVGDMMHNIFNHTGATNRLLHTVHERFSHIHAVAWKGASRPQKRNLENDFVAVDNKIYNAARPPFEGKSGARRMMQVFLISQRRHLPVSHETIQQIQQHTDLVNDEVRSDKQISDIFMKLLSGSVGVADRLVWMRECGLLQTYLQELMPLVHRVDYDQSYDYTLDEHSIGAVRVIDNLAHTRDPDQVTQREMLSRIQDDHLLRFALLTHHTGGRADDTKAMARRIGLPQSDVETLHFLTENQNLLTTLARRHQLNNEAQYEDAAETVGSAGRLHMLYLMTYADCRARGRLGWFSWLDAHLFEAYNKLLAILQPGAETSGTPETFRRRLIESASDAGMEDEARRFTDILPERYAIEVDVEEALDHIKLIDRLDDQPAAMSWNLDHHTARVWLCSSDVPARFSQVAGVLTAHDLNILNAHAFSLDDGTVLDRFVVHNQNGPLNTNRDFWENVRSTLLDSVSGQIDLDDLVRERVSRDEHEPPPTTRRHVTNIHLDNESSSRFTILDLVTWDRMGLLYFVGKCLSEQNANIEFAHVSTRMDIAEDVFYINDKTTGDPITSSKRLADLRERLLEMTASELTTE